MESEIRIFNFKKGLSIEFEIKSLTDIKKFPELFTYPKKASFYQLVWIEKGKATFFIDFKEVTIHSQEAILISVNQLYGFDIVSEYEGKMILFTDSFFNHTELDTLFLHNSHILNPVHRNKVIRFCPGYMESLINLLELELQQPKDSFQAYIVQSMLRAVLLEAERNSTKNEGKLPDWQGKNVARMFFDEVETHFKDHKQVDFYIQKLGIYEKTLSKEVKIVTGKTPKQYIEARLVLEAKRLLVYSRLSIKEISFKLNWDESTNFIKFFKKQIGVTPLEFRNSHILTENYPD